MNMKYIVQMNTYLQNELHYSQQLHKTKLYFPVCIIFWPCGQYPFQRQGILKEWQQLRVACCPGNRQKYLTATEINSVANIAVSEIVCVSSAARIIFASSHVQFSETEYLHCSVSDNKPERKRIKPQANMKITDRFVFQFCAAECSDGWYCMIFTALSRPGQISATWTMTYLMIFVTNNIFWLSKMNYAFIHYELSFVYQFCTHVITYTWFIHNAGKASRD